MDKRIKNKEIAELQQKKFNKLSKIIKNINSTEEGKYFLDYLKSINEEAIYNFKLSDNLLSFNKGMNYFYMVGVKRLLDAK